jgi:hypothetical protein
VIRDPEAAYFQAVEEFFVAQRGDPLFLSNADWLLVRRWRQQGLPLRIVLRGIRDALDAHAHSWSRKRKVGSLHYCEAEVETARERWERALGAGEEPGQDVAATLDGFAAALAQASGLGPEGAAVAGRIAGRLRELASASPRPRDVEPELAQLEAELTGVLRADTPSAVVSEQEGEVDAALGPYKARLPAKVFGDLRAQSLTRRLLESHGLPRLSLFGL